MDKKRILVTGKTSYIGTNFINYINGLDGYEAEAISVRGEDWKSLDFGQYDVVYDVARIAHMKESEEIRHLYFDVNCNLAVDIAKKAKADGVKQFIYLSSLSVYGVLEGRIDSTTPELADNLYGRSKLRAERRLRELADDNFIVSIVRPPMIYGEGSRGNYLLLKKYALKFRMFPNVANERSMISIENMSKVVADIVANPKSKTYHPQDPDYVKIHDIVKQVTEDAGLKFHTIHIGLDLVKMLTNRVYVFKKAFGSLVCDQLIDDERIRVEDLVSIIMPMYNAAAVVAAAIKSVQAQDYENWELFVVDDGSTDNSSEVVKALAEKDNRIHLIQKKNGGVASARNAGLCAANGRYIAFLDSDDKWHDGKLTKQLNLLKEKHAKMCFSGTAFMDEAGNDLHKFWPVPAEVDYKKLQRTNVIPCSSVLVDRKGLKFFYVPNQGHEDYATWLMILRDNPIKAYGINEPLFSYRKSKNGLSSSKIRTLRWTWHVYFDSLGYSWLKSTYCFLRCEVLTMCKYLRGMRP